MNKISMIGVFLSLFLVACNQKVTDSERVYSIDDNQPIKIILSSEGSDADIWRFIAQSDLGKQENLQITVKEINDGIASNLAVINGDADVNAHQSWAYLLAFNKAYQNKLTAVSTTYLEPMGLYSKKYQDLKQLPNNALVTLPNDAANLARGLRLLASAGLIELKKDFDEATGIPQDILSNPKKLKIKLIEYSAGARVLNEVDIAAINNTVALESGLNVLQDSLFHEPIDASMKNNINVLVVATERKDDPIFQKLGKLYHAPEVIKYVKEKFGGTKVNVDKPIEYLSE